MDFNILFLAHNKYNSVYFSKGYKLNNVRDYPIVSQKIQMIEKKNCMWYFNNKTVLALLILKYVDRQPKICLILVLTKNTITSVISAWQIKGENIKASKIFPICQ